MQNNIETDPNPSNSEKYLPGMRIKLLETMTNDPQPVEAGAYGTVTSVDDAGHIHMTWDDNQGSLSLIPEVDNFVIVKLTLQEFVATKKEVECIEKELHNADVEDKKPGYIYLDGFNIEKCDDGSYLLILGRTEYNSTDLSSLEEVLYHQHFYY